MRTGSMRALAAGVLLFGAAMTGVARAGGQPVRGQQSPVVQAAPGSAITAACGADGTSFITKKVATPWTEQAPADKALVVIVETLPALPFVSKETFVGIDGQWLGALKEQTYTTVLLDAGVHHMCVSYRGHIAVREQGSLILHRLNLQAGKTYYMQYRGIFVEGYGLVASLEEVDEDEGTMLVQGAERMTSTPKK